MVNVNHNFTDSNAYIVISKSLKPVGVFAVLEIILTETQITAADGTFCS